MSDDVKTPEGNPQAANELGNLKQEFNRKLGSYEQKLSELASTNQALLQKLSQLTQPKVETRDEDDIDKVWYDDPRKAAAKIKEQTKAEIMAEYNKAQEAQARTQSTLAALVADYPELNDAGHDLTRKAVELYNSMSDSEKTSPVAYKAAVREAAAELGIVPMKRRSSDDEAFTGSASNGYAASTQRKAKSKDDLDPRTIAFAQLVGLKVDDAKTMENLKNRAKRQNWNKYE